MVLGLVVDIADSRINSRDADTERSISFLPFKRLELGKCFMNSFGRIALEKLHGFRDGERRRQ